MVYFGATIVARLPLFPFQFDWANLSFALLSLAELIATLDYTPQSKRYKEICPVNVVGRAVDAAESFVGVRATKAERIVAGAFLAIVALLICAAYFTPHVWHHGEAREGLVVQDIVNNHRWILPLRNGELPSKPILYHWMAAFFALLLGLSDFAVRLPSVVAAVLLIGVTYYVAAFATNRKTALYAVGILAATYEFWDSGTDARVDMLFASLIGLALVAWYFWYRTGREFARSAAYLAIALAVLTKGPAGAILPGLVIFCFLLCQRELGRLRDFFSWSWVLMVVAIDLGWYLAAYERGGTPFFQKQIVYENVERFFGAGEFEQKRSGSQAIWLITQLFPWSSIVLLAPIRWFRGHRQDDFGRFLHAWWLTIFAFFLFAAGRRAVYLLPVYPAVALLAAREIVAFLDAQQGTFVTRRFSIKASVAAVVVIAALDFTLAIATPVSRTVREDSSDQEEFFEEAIPEIPSTEPLYAAEDFPESALMVLAYRLNRDIRLRPLVCQGKYYYLATESFAGSCAQSITSTESHSPKHSLQLLHVSEPGR